MTLLENIKKTLKDGSEKVVKIAEDITEKLKEVGEEGLELSKDVLAEISEKTSDITKIGRSKFEMSELNKEINSEMKELGELVFEVSSSKRKQISEEKFLAQIKCIENLKKDLSQKKAEYEALRKIYSNNFVIQKFSDELAESDAIIDQVIVSGESDSINKPLKSLVLPKKALISAIKRNDEVIIPDGNTKILADDMVTIVGKKADVKKVINKLSKK